MAENTYLLNGLARSHFPTNNGHMAGQDYTIEELPKRRDAASPRVGDESREFSDLDALLERWMTSAPPQIDQTEDPPVPMPEGIDVRRSEGSISIDRRWMSNQFYFTLIFGIIWNVILFPMIGVFLGTGAVGMGPFGALMLLFFLPFLSVGVGMIYYSIAGFRNTTSVVVGGGTIRVVHRPLPWPGEQKIEAGDVTQLYVKEVRHTSSSSSSSRTRRTSYTYTVMVVYGAQNREKTLVRSLTEVNQAFFIEYTIERFLGITDRSIRGEIRKV